MGRSALLLAVLAWMLAACTADTFVPPPTGLKYDGGSGGDGAVDPDGAEPQQDAAVDGGASGDGGNTDASTTTDSGPPLNYKRVFVSSAVYAKGNLGGLAGADAICTGLAQAAGMSGTWKAWLTSATVQNVEDRLDPNAGPYKTVTGTFIGTTLDSIAWNGGPAAPINIDENGNSIGTNAINVVYTGTDGNGKVQSSACTTDGGLNCWTCNDWNGGGNGVPVSYGNCNDTQQWTNFFKTACTDQARVYCFEQ